MENEIDRLIFFGSEKLPLSVLSVSSLEQLLEPRENAAVAGPGWASPGDAALAGSLWQQAPASTCRQQQAAQLEVGPVGSPSLNPMASTLLEA